MIELHTLRLDGWLSYDKAEFTLDNPGITRIMGTVGSGKSAIPEAVFYLLFGKTLRGKDSVNDLVNKVLDNGYEIELEFSVDGVNYRVREVRGRPNKGVFFYTNGTSTLGKTDPDTRNRIIKAIGMSADDFRSIAFLGQRQTQLLVEGKPAERGKAIVDIFSLNRYDEIIVRCETDIKEATKERKDLEETLERFTKELESLEESLSDDEDDEDVSQDDFDAIEIKISEISGKVSKIRKLATTIREVIAKASAINEQKARLKTLMKDINALKSDLANRTQPQESVDELDELLEALLEDYSDVQGVLKRARRAIENAKNMDNTCPVTQADCPVNIPVDKQADTIKANKKKLKKSKAKFEKIGKEISDHKADRKFAKEYEKREDAIYLKEAAVAALSTTVKNTANISEEKLKLQKYDKGITDGNAKLQELIEDRTDVKAALAVYREREAMRKKVDAALADKDEAITELKESAEAKSIEVQYLAGALSVFKKMKMYKIDLVLHLINANLKDILEQISDGEYRAEFLSQKKTSDNKRMMDKVRILVYDSNMEIPIELCSGGQATEVGLAVLLSTWKAANSISNKGVSSLWLDEVFGPLSEEIVDKTFDAVLAVANDLGTTVVNIISHRDLDMRRFDYVWEITRRNGISSAKIF